MPVIINVNTTERWTCMNWKRINCKIKTAFEAVDFLYFRNVKEGQWSGGPWNYQKSTEIPESTPKYGKA